MIICNRNDIHFAGKASTILRGGMGHVTTRGMGVVPLKKGALTARGGVNLPPPWTCHCSDRQSRNLDQHGLIRPWVSDNLYFTLVIY